MAAKPIIMTITNSAKNAMLDSENTGITLRLERLAIGSGRYNPSGNEAALKNEISRHVITVGDIEPATHTLRLFSVVKATTETEVWELGLYDTENRLFALASSTDKPLFKVYPDIDFVGNFAIKLDAFDTSKVQVVTDPNGALSLVLMSQHLAHPNPHPQYLLRNEYTPEPIKVGGILITTNDYANSQEVHDGEGYGKWAKFSEGQLLLGVGSHTDKNGTTRNISMMQQLGEYEHQLTVEEMPSHKHDMGEHFGGNLNLSSLSSTTNNDERRGIDTNNPSAMLNPTGSSGGGQSHNNIQPSIGVGMWLRLPNDYTATSFDIYFTSDALGQNRVGQINEDSAIYLWIDVANATVPIAVSEFKQQGAGEFISDGANFTYPPTINNGKNLMIGVLPENYHVDMQTIIDWGFNLYDAAIGKTQYIHAGLTINDTVSDAPPYNGLKFEIRVYNDRGRIKCVPTVLENNSPFTLRTPDPFTEAEGTIDVVGVPANLENPWTYFTIEQTSVNGYLNFKMARYRTSNGESSFTVLSDTGIDLFRNGQMSDGTLVGTVKLTYQP